ncbi:alpha/beta fold hydrolase [Paenochrobactrum sp. BZR 588]|uniref:alpha/beta fold hydrolase n=1 Tax=unclassified Paenochrobactrum TaxID=2639760 RepID=UPI003851925F
MTTSAQPDTHEKADEILFETSDNLKPQQFQAGFLTSKDHKKLRYALVPSHPQHNRGTIILLHGRNECIEKYYETIDDLHMRGFHTATMDWRGQGHSDRLIKNKNRGFVRRFKDYTDDLEQFIHSIVLNECPPPYYILAHSAGGLITLSAMPHLIPYIDRIVLAAPLLGFPSNKLSEKNLRRLSRLMTFSGFGKTYAKRGIPPGNKREFSGNILTSDQIRYERNQKIIYNHPTLGLAGPTFTWVFNALHAIHQLNRPKNLTSPKIPTLFILAGGDTIVSSRAAQDYARKIRGASFITIDGARHELMQEDDHYRQQFWAAFDAFIPDAQNKPIISQDKSQ